MNNIVPRSTKRRSQVWQHFEIINQEKAKCNCCGVQLHFRGSTFNLRRHLENKHKQIDVSKMIRIKGIKKRKINCPKNETKASDADSEDSFYWEENHIRDENGGEHIEDILIESDHSLSRSDEITETKHQLRVVSFDFADFKSESEALSAQKEENNHPNYNVEITRLQQNPAKVTKMQGAACLRTEDSENDKEFRETKIFGDFVASQLRILSKTKREKLQILIQRAILDVVCEDGTMQAT